MPGPRQSTDTLRPTSFARMVQERVPADATIAVLGAAQNDDALWFAAQGHAVTAVCTVDTTKEKAERADSDAVHTLVMEAYNFDYPATLDKANIQFTKRAAALGMSVSTVQYDLHASRFHLPLGDASVDVLYGFVFMPLSGLEGFTPTVVQECRRVLRPQGWFAAVQYGVQTTDDLTDCVEERPGVYRRKESGTVLYRATIDAVQKSMEEMFDMVLLDEQVIAGDDLGRSEFNAPFRVVRAIACRK